MMKMVFDAGFGRSDDARYLPERKEAECNTALVQGNPTLQSLSRAITEFAKEPSIFYFSRFRVLERNLELQPRRHRNRHNILVQLCAERMRTKGRRLDDGLHTAS
jgi:hypothetical protein